MPASEQRGRRCGRRLQRGGGNARELGLRLLEPVGRGQVREQRNRPVEVAARLPRIIGRSTEKHVGAAELQPLPAIGEERNRDLPALHGVVPAARRLGDLAAHAVGDRVLEAILDPPRQATCALAGLLGLVETLEGAQRLRAPTLDLDHRVAFGRHALAACERALVAGERAVRASAVHVQLAEELECQHLLAPGIERASPLERAEQSALGVHEPALQARDVSSPDRHLGEPEIVRDLE